MNESFKSGFIKAALSRGLSDKAAFTVLKLANDDKPDLGTALKDLGATVGTQAAGYFGLKGYSHLIDNHPMFRSDNSQLQNNVANQLLDKAKQMGYNYPSTRPGAQSFIDTNLFGRFNIPDIQEPITRSNVNILDKTINVPKDAHPGWFAHEFGHILQGPNKVRFGNAIPRTISNLSNIPIGMSNNEDTTRHIAQIGSAAGGATLLNELGASARGYRAMSGSGLGILQKLKAFSGVPTYAMGALLPWLTYKARQAAGAFNHNAN